MDALDDRDTRAEPPDPFEGDGADVAALWSALAANDRARDERTARLRAMRLIDGDDATGRP